LTSPRALAAATGLVWILLSVTSPVRADERILSTFDASRVVYGPHGLEYKTDDGNTALWLGGRLQFRYSTLKGNPVEPGKLPQQDDEEAKLNRARIKFGGHAFTPRFVPYLEYDLVDDRLLDLWGLARARNWFRLRGGQWKTRYNRERIDSSGRQQLADRSIANFWFTVDRQQGASVSGRLDPGGRADSHYWVALLSGDGREGSLNAGDPMLVGRYQWNFLGRHPKFSQSDIARLQRPVGALTLAAVTARTRFTRYSSAGGGQLPGFDAGVEDQYQLYQLMLETVYKHRGFSHQGELHFKQVDDRIDGTTRRLAGGYLQAGWFPSEKWSWVPAPFEVAGRLGLVDPDTSVSEDLQHEATIGVNWFFNGHRNKLTADFGYILLDDPQLRHSETRLRLQWDVSF